MERFGTNFVTRLSGLFVSPMPISEEQSDRRYCQLYNNQGADEIILPLFPAYLCYFELLGQHFLPVLLKLQLYQLRSNIHIKSFMYLLPQEELARKFSKLEEHPRRFTIRQHYSKINAPFSQNFSLNHRINT
jgi:hypothetical protein